MSEFNKYRIIMEHTLVITNEVLVRHKSFAEAEGVAAAIYWKKYPTNKMDREHTCVTMTPTKFTTTRVDDHKR